MAWEGNGMGMEGKGREWKGERTYHLATSGGSVDVGHRIAGICGYPKGHLRGTGQPTVIGVEQLEKRGTVNVSRSMGQGVGHCTCGGHSAQG